MVQQVTSPEDIAQRKAKAIRKAANIKTQETLDKVLASFPEEIRRDVYNELRPLLSFDPKEFQ